jgi:D-alanine-D-alanine ligase
MKKLRVMMLTHSNLIPPEGITERSDPKLKDCETEFDVKNALLNLGHEVKIIGVDDSIKPIQETIQQWKPHIAYNMMEAFADIGSLDYYIASYLDMVKIPYTGCNPRGMLLSRDKSLSKKILTYHRIRVPKFFVFPRNKKINEKKLNNLPYPLIIKSTVEQGSVGIAQSSYVTSPHELNERVIQLFDIAEGDAIAEQFIDGRELYATVIGNKRLEVFPIRELVFDKIDENIHKIATYTVKWNEKYRKKYGIDYQFVRNLPSGMPEKIVKLCKRTYRVLGMSGYARIDLRLSDDGKLYVIEANPNAGIASDDDVAFSAEKAGYNYEQLIQRVLNLGLRYHQESGIYS